MRDMCSGCKVYKVVLPQIDGDGKHYCTECGKTKGLVNCNACGNFTAKNHVLRNGHLCNKCFNPNKKT